MDVVECFGGEVIDHDGEEDLGHPRGVEGAPYELHFGGVEEGDEEVLYEGLRVDEDEAEEEGEGGEVADVVGVVETGVVVAGDDDGGGFVIIVVVEGDGWCGNDASVVVGVAGDTGELGGGGGVAAGVHVGRED